MILPRSRTRPELMRTLNPVMKACLSIGCLVAFLVITYSFDIASLRTVYFMDVVETEVHTETTRTTSTSNTIVYEFTTKTNSNPDLDRIPSTNTKTPSSSCFGNVPRHNSKCGYFANIVESMKSGTTALWNLMHQSPQIGGLTVHCNFTDYDYCLTKANASPTKINIDKGPEGPRCSSLVDRMYEVAPYQRLVFLFRHPVDRLYSHYQHQVRSAVMHYNGTFKEWVHKELGWRCYNPETGSWKQCFNHQNCTIAKNAMAISAYAELLELYWTRFPRNETYILITEEVYADTQKHMNDLMEWLGLDRLTFRAPKNSNIRSYEPLDPEYRKELYEKYFEAEVKRLEVYMGRKLPWKA